jgi:hypothetical protein
VPERMSRLPSASWPTGAACKSSTGCGTRARRIAAGEALSVSSACAGFAGLPPTLATALMAGLAESARPIKAVRP